MISQLKNASKEESYLTHEKFNNKLYPHAI